MAGTTKETAVPFARSSAAVSAQNPVAASSFVSIQRTAAAAAAAAGGGGGAVRPYSQRRRLSSSVSVPVYSEKTADSISPARIF